MPERSHRLGIEIDISSEAALTLHKAKLMQVKSLIEDEPYRLTIGLKNLGASDFPGGDVKLVILWASERKSYWKLETPSLKPGEKKQIPPTHSDTVGSGGLALIYCYSVTSKDGKTVTLWDQEGFDQYDVDKDARYAIRGVHCTTWSEVHTKYGVLIAAIGLAIVALEKLVSLLLLAAHLLADP